SVLPESAVPAPAAAPASAAATPAAQTGDLPEWLKTITQGQAATVEPAAGTAEPPMAPLPPQPAAPTDDLPDWLKAITQGQADQPATASQVKPAEPAAAPGAVPQPRAATPQP